MPTKCQKTINQEEECNENEGSESKRRMNCLRAFGVFLVIWGFSCVFILNLLLQVDELRSYFLRDLFIDKKYSDKQAMLERIRKYDVERENLASKITYDALNLKPEIDLQSKNKRCTAERNVVFLKTHKTASSTVTNILNRYADLRELTVALPSMGEMRFAWPRKFHWSSADLLRLNGRPANILANHARYNREQMDLIMEDGVKYISILREPVTQFESSFFYFEFDKILKLNATKNPIERFMRFPDEYLYNLTLRLGDLPETLNLLQSGMFYDFGYDFIDMEPNEAIARVLNKLEREFDLIMITEYFDESLVLLKRQMCWQFDDILYIKQNQRLKKTALSADTKSRIRQWNRADVILYQRFNRTLWRKIREYGEKEFSNDLKEFKKLNAEFQRKCSPQRVVKKAFRINVDVASFEMNPKADHFERYLCEKVFTDEIQYISYFKKKFSTQFGYQSMLLAEGAKSLDEPRTLNRKLKKHVRKGPKFFKLFKSGAQNAKQTNKTVTDELKIKLEKIL